MVKRGQSRVGGGRKGTGGREYKHLTALPLWTKLAYSYPLYHMHVRTQLEFLVVIGA